MEKWRRKSFVSSTQVIAFKAGKRTFTGDKLKVRNPDGTETPELTYTRATAFRSLGVAACHRTARLLECTT